MDLKALLVRCYENWQNENWQNEDSQNY